MKKAAKTKQIVARFGFHSYEKIGVYAEPEHRGPGEFVRHTTRFYMEHFDQPKESANKEGGERL